VVVSSHSVPFALHGVSFAERVRLPGVAENEHWVQSNVAQHTFPEQRLVPTWGHCGDLKRGPFLPPRSEISHGKPDFTVCHRGPSLEGLSGRHAHGVLLFLVLCQAPCPKNHCFGDGTSPSNEIV